MTSKNKSSLINPFSYWVIPGKVAAGEYPGNQYSFRISTTVATIIHSFRALAKSKGRFWNSSEKKIESLLDAGIRTFVDLTQDLERPTYRGTLHRLRRERSIDCKYIRFPIKDRGTPSEDLMKELIQYVNLEVASGRPVYIHCFRGLGRTGLAVGCFVSQPNFEIEDVFSFIKKLRKGVAGDFRKSPETAMQEEFLIDWWENKNNNYCD